MERLELRLLKQLELAIQDIREEGVDISVSYP